MSRIPALSLGGTLKFALLFAAGAALVGYVGFQARSLIAGPSLTMHTADMPYTERVALVEGTARNISTITLNDRPIFTDDEGHFSEHIVLENGYTILTLRAQDRYGRETSLKRGLVYAPAYESLGHD